jgi:hypothetical protein
MAKIKVKQLTSGNNQFGKVLISDGLSGVSFYDISGLTYNIQKGTGFTLTPSSGDLFYRTDVDLLFHYDDSRSKWLTVNKHSLNCGRSSITAGGTIYMRVGDATHSSTVGFKMDRNGTIIGGSIQNVNIVTSVKNVEIRVNNSTINKVTLPISIGTSGTSLNNFNLDFNDGDLIQVVCVPGLTGSALSNGIAVVNIAYRI